MRFERTTSSLPITFACFLLFQLFVSYRRNPLRHNGFAIFFGAVCCKILPFDVAPFNLYVAPFVAPKTALVLSANLGRNGNKNMCGNPFRPSKTSVILENTFSYIPQL